MNSRLLDALKQQNYASPPVWLMRQAGRYMPSYRSLRKQYSFLEMCHQPELITHITQLPIQELHVDAAIIFSDILMVPEAMGFNIHFEDGVGPIIKNALQKPHEVSLIPEISLEHLEYLKQAINLTKRAVHVPLIGFTGAPFTLASYLIEGKTSRDLHHTKVWAYRHQEAFSTLIHKLEAAIITSLNMQIQAGCDVVQIFDSWAFVLSESHFKRWCLNSLKRIVSAMSPSKTPILYFCRGSSHLAELIATTGVTAISLDWTRPIAETRKKLPKLPLQGNLDPEALYLNPADLTREVQDLLHSMNDDPAYIFNLGHGVLPDVPYDNVKLLIETIQMYR